MLKIFINKRKNEHEETMGCVKTANRGNIGWFWGRGWGTTNFRGKLCLSLWTN
jgi:hypothetical protein